MSYQIGQIVTGTVTGIQPYGGFIKLDEQTQGLVHISEFKSGVVKDLSGEFKIGDRVKVVILDIDQYSGKISLSLRQVGIMALKNTSIIKNNSIKRHFWTNYHLDYGFEPIALALPGWVEEAKKRLS
ncbi:CvfD/Ygs/GSP13 family RNA-binding post-transcriptional regulator [Fructobacillus ficulneus]|uniref:RNA binding protein with S1 domain n=1 Tax=Fructobacillus ficulneus TaxID=157463 RepID=A0A0K8MIM0_9LACO|nr:CvfD/Ygs/GSP13 family RNA-binding post-transcriptional regulator [Fructobacillus ficulneus]GAO99729.1 RNA binding protein with S1 domain [Fructobacillus ficulneus]